jgi:hypothetical protein
MCARCRYPHDKRKQQKGYYFSLLLFSSGLEFGSTFRSARFALQPSSETKPTATGSRFVRCIQLHTVSAASAALPPLSRTPPSYEEVDNAQDTDHDGRERPANADRRTGI